MKTGKVLEDLLIKPISGDHFHTIAHAVLETIGMHVQATGVQRTICQRQPLIGHYSTGRRALHGYMQRCKISE